MTDVSGIAVPVAIFACGLLVWGGFRVLFSGGDRLKGVLMIVAAVVLAGNIVILTY